METQASRALVEQPDDKVQTAPETLGMDEILRLYGETIKQVIDSGNRRRFVTVQAMCKQATQLMELQATRAGEFNALARRRANNIICTNGDLDGDTDDGGYDGVVGGLNLGGFGREGEAMRQVIAALQSSIGPVCEKNKADAAVARASELEILLRTKVLLGKKGTKDIEARILSLRKEIGDAVVPAVVLRRHQTGEVGPVAGSGKEGSGDGGDVEPAHGSREGRRRQAR